VIPSRLASLFFKPSRNSITRWEEFRVSAVDKTFQPDPSTEEEVVVAAIGVAVLRTFTYLPADFGGPLTEDFLRTTMLSE
jgi:hypothetical protein